MAKRWFFLSFLALSLLNSTRGDDYACQMDGPCRCNFANEQHLDLRHLLPDDNHFIAATKGRYTFYYHGCTDVDFNVDVQNINKSSCGSSPLTLCLFDETQRSLMYLGTAADSSIQQDKQFPHIQELVYRNNTLKTVVRLICAGESPESTLVVKTMGPQTNVLDLYSASVCRIDDHSGLSAGSKMIITFLVLGSLYFTAGSLLNYYIRGARGKEVIPNIDFWTSLPGLVKDGVVFVMNGCNPQMVTTADTYDQI